MMPDPTQPVPGPTREQPDPGGIVAEILAPDVVANLSRRRSMEPRNIADLCASHEALRELAGQHDPTGADHMEQMWEHAQRADAAELVLRNLLDACERGRPLADIHDRLKVEVGRLNRPDGDATR